MKHCYLDAYQCLRAGRNNTVLFHPRFSAEMCVSVSISTVILSHLIYVVLLFFFGFFFCIKLKSETQNIYNFCIEKKKNVKPKKSEKMEIIFYCVGKEVVSGKKKMLQKILSFLHL